MTEANDKQPNAKKLLNKAGIGCIVYTRELQSNRHNEVLIQRYLGLQPPVPIHSPFDDNLTHHSCKTVGRIIDKL